MTRPRMCEFYGVFIMSKPELIAHIKTLNPCINESSLDSYDTDVLERFAQRLELVDQRGSTCVRQETTRAVVTRRRQWDRRVHLQAA